MAAQQSGMNQAASAQPAEPDESSTADIPLPQVFRIQKVAYFTVPMVLVVTIILSGASLVWLGWTLVLPVLLAIWIGRIRTIVTEDGLRAVHTFGTRDIAWDDIAGLQFPRWGSVRAVLTDKSRVRLPAIMFQDLPRLSLASGGRIPDPYPHRR
ncbi:PH domain-containing protein [Gordonia sinesedis]